MLTILRDPVWQFFGAFLALLALGASFQIYFLQRKRKDFAVGVLSSKSLLGVATELEHRLLVTFNGTPIKTLAAIDVGFKNSGNVAILHADFVRPFKLFFGPESMILSSEIVAQAPPDLDAQVTHSGESLDLHPLLLNAGDFVVARLLVAGNIAAVRTEARIIDIPLIAKLTHNIYVSNRRSTVQHVLVMLLIASASLAAALHLAQWSLWAFTIVCIIGLASVLTIWWEEITNNVANRNLQSEA